LAQKLLSDTIVVLKGLSLLRKIRQLKADLRRAGFVEHADRGKGGHGMWFHPVVTGVSVNLSGRDGDDAQPYQERQVRDAIVQVSEETSS
jgi:hypothetical protein